MRAKRLRKQDWWSWLDALWNGSSSCCAAKSELTRFPRRHIIRSISGSSFLEPALLNVLILTAHFWLSFASCSDMPFLKRSKG